MRIVQLLPELNEGGVERGTVELNRELVQQGYESIVISNGGKLVEQVEADGGRHIFFDLCSKNLVTVPWRIYRLKMLLQTINPDIIHARSRVPAWLAYLANQNLHIPFVTTVHGFNSVSPYSEVMTKGDRVICVSNAIKQYVMENYGTDAEKITVIPRGIDLETFNPLYIDQAWSRNFVREFDLDGKFVVTTVGRITQLKDLETFIQAIAKVKKTMPNVKALIVGGVRGDKQGYFNTLNELVGQLRLTEEVLFTGSQKHVAEIYSLSNVVVSCSKKPETFGRSVAEAIAMNTPVIATRHGGVLDIIKEGENGFFIDVGDAYSLSRFIIEAKTLDFDGYSDIAERFSLRQMVEKTLSVYQEVRRP